MDTAQGRPRDALEYTAGAGGAAFLVGPAEESVAVLEGSTSYVTDTADFWRRQHEHYPAHAGRFTGEPGYFRHVVAAASEIMAALGRRPADYAHVIFHQPNTKFPRKAGRELGFKSEQLEAGLLVNDIGNTYAGAAMIGLTGVLDVAEPGERVLMVSFGSGAGSDAFDLRVTDAITARRACALSTRDYVVRRHEIDYATYARHRERSAWSSWAPPRDTQERQDELFETEMRDVSIIGLGQTPVGEHWEKSLKDLAGEAIQAAIKDAQVERVDVLYVGNMCSGTLNGQEHLGALISDWVGLRGVEAVKIEAACGSGAAALRLGYVAVAGELADFVVVAGVEKMTDRPGEQVTAALAMASDADFEAQNGLSFVALNALLMRRYMHEYGVCHREFAPFAINAHKNAMGNPYALFPHPVTAEDFCAAKMIADPVNLLDSSPVCDGAAAVVLCPTEIARQFNCAAGAHSRLVGRDRYHRPARSPRSPRTRGRGPECDQGVQPGQADAQRHRSLRAARRIYHHVGALA